jgi:lipopolysaccharide export system protein LptC
MGLVIVAGESNSMEISHKKYRISIILCLIIIVLLIGLNIQTFNQLNDVVMEKNKSMFHIKKLEVERFNLEEEKEELENKLEDNQ